MACAPNGCCNLHKENELEFNDHEVTHTHESFFSNPSQGKNPVKQYVFQKCTSTPLIQGNEPAKLISGRNSKEPYIEENSAEGYGSSFLTSHKASIAVSVYSPPPEVKTIEEVKNERFETGESQNIFKPKLAMKNWIWRQVVNLLIKSKVELD